MFLVLDDGTFAEAKVFAVGADELYNNEKLGADSIVVDQVRLMDGKALKKATLWYGNDLYQWSPGTKFNSKQVKQYLATAAVSVPLRNVQLAV